MAKPRLTSFYRQLIRSIADRFGLSPTLSFDHRPFRTIGTYFVLLPTTSFLCRPFRSFADLTSYFRRLHFVLLPTIFRTFADVQKSDIYLFSERWMTYTHGLTYLTKNLTFLTP
jgi:hypothetical protein